MGLDCQMLQKSPPLNLLAGSVFVSDPYANRFENENYFIWVHGFSRVKNYLEFMVAACNRCLVDQRQSFHTVELSNNSKRTSLTFAAPRRLGCSCASWRPCSCASGSACGSPAAGRNWRTRRTRHTSSRLCGRRRASSASFESLRHKRQAANSCSNGLLVRKSAVLAEGSSNA